MKLTLNGIKDTAAWAQAGIRLPAYDVEAVAKKTGESPVWVHFGAGNIFRIFIGGIADKLLESGSVDYVTFTSASTVHNFVQMVKNRENLDRVLGVCIGRQTREAAEGYHLRTIPSQAATIDSICECILHDQKDEVE